MSDDRLKYVMGTVDEDGLMDTEGYIEDVFPEGTEIVVISRSDFDTLSDIFQEQLK